MKKLLLLPAFLLLFVTSCKKEENTPLVNLTSNFWLLTSATVNPAKTSGGKTSTNLLLLDPSTCLSNSYTMKFQTDGQYFVGSSGPLCDMIGGSQPFVYEDNKLKLNKTDVTVNTLNSKKFSYNFTTVESGTTYTYNYTFKNEK